MWAAPDRMQGSMLAQRGYSYVAVLFLVALTALGLASLGKAWSTAAQRERERELAFRGKEIAHAIEAYVRASPGPHRQFPKRLEDLVLDERGSRPRHHLRRLYVDPFTGMADWQLVQETSQPGAFSAVRSRSDHALLGNWTGEGAAVYQARDLVFSARTHADGNDSAIAPAARASGAAAVR